MSIAGLWRNFVSDYKNVHKIYPYESGDSLVLGPEVFVNEGRDTICWRGVNYYRFDD